MILFTQSTVVLHKYVNDELKILCLLQFFSEVAQNSLSFPRSEKSLSIPGFPSLWPPCHIQKDTLAPVPVFFIGGIAPSPHPLDRHQRTGNIEFFDLGSIVLEFFGNDLELVNTTFDCLYAVVDDLNAVRRLLNVVVHRVQLPVTARQVASET